MKILYSVLLLAGLGGTAWAGALDGTGYAQRGTGLLNIRPALGNLFASSLPTKPLYKGMREAKISAGIFEMEQKKGFISQSLPGSGASVSAVYGFSSHWGITGLAGFASSKGDYSGFSSYGGSITGKPEEKAFNAAVNLVWDPFSGDNFRMPIMLGVSYMKYSEDLRMPFVIQSGSLAGHNALITEEYSYNEFGYSTGIAPQFNTGRLRWVPFFFGISAINKDKRKYTEKDLDTGQVYTATPNTDESGCVVGGLQVVYRPWNLSYSYIVPVLSDIKVSDGDNLSSHTISFSKKF